MTNLRVANYKTAGNDKITPLTVRCQLQSILTINRMINTETFDACIGMIIDDKFFFS